MKRDRKKKKRGKKAQRKKKQRKRKKMMICLRVGKLQRDYNEKKKNETTATENIEKPISFCAESPNFKAGLKRTSTMAFERTGAAVQDFLEFFKTPMNTEPESRKNSSLPRERTALIDRFA